MPTEKVETLVTSRSQLVCCDHYRDHRSIRAVHLLSQGYTRKYVKLTRVNSNARQKKGFHATARALARTWYAFPQLFMREKLDCYQARAR